MPFTGRIEEIWAQFNGAHETIWRAGDAAPRKVVVPVGASWELHVKTIASWPEVGQWATAVTIYGELHAGDAALHAFSAGDREFAFNMPKMPDRDFNVGRVRFWANRAYTNVPPPEADR
ncbi:MAG TPA: hypothetical protein VMV84_03745 [Dehalococcoidales bacterium]|nr:hypothetical protein [Dehalococcoidales bacterium]